jgi:hypothetical protein
MQVVLQGLPAGWSVPSQLWTAPSDTQHCTTLSLVLRADDNQAQTSFTLTRASTGEVVWAGPATSATKGYNTTGVCEADPRRGGAVAVRWAFCL